MGDEPIIRTNHLGEHHSSKVLFDPYPSGPSMNLYDMGTMFAITMRIIARHFLERSGKYIRTCPMDF